MNEIILDLETKETFDEVGSYNPELLHMSLLGAYISEVNDYKAYREDGLGKLWPYLERADIVVGYNIKGFDWPVLKKYYTGDINKIPTLDMLEVLKNALGFRLKLDSVAKANLPFSKSGHGLLAVEYYKKGEWEKLEKYCLDDVRVTREVYNKGRDNKMLYYTDNFGTKKAVAVDFTLKKGPSDKPIN